MQLNLQAVTAQGEEGIRRGAQGPRPCRWDFSRKPTGFSEQVCFRPFSRKGLGWGSFHEKGKVIGHREQTVMEEW